MGAALAGDARGRGGEVRAVTMAVALVRLMARYRQALERFLPAAMAKDREARNRALMFLVSHTIGPVLGNTVPLALYAFDPTPGWDVAVLAAGISLFWLFPFLLRAGVAYERLVLASVLDLNFCILWSCYHYGGVASPTLPWVLVIPILALFYIGGEQRQQPHLLTVTAASFVTFGLAYFLLEPPPNDIPDAAMVGLGAVSTVATLCYVATMAVYYARIFDAGVDLEVEIGRRRLMAEELRRAVLAADRSGSAKAEFLARMSHEIRTPLNAIIGYGEILREEATDEDDEALKVDVERILDAGHYLVRLINMILDLSKIEAGRMVFDVRPHPIGTLLEKAVAARRAEIEAGGNHVSVTVAPGLDLVEVDATRLTQVVDGILENAARHTQGGAVAVSASEELVEGLAGGLAGEQRVLVVAIRDTGAGIAPDVLPTLFRSFSTARAASGGRYGGTGLGLTVGQRLCQAMNGAIAVHSVPGQGSTFTVTLPRVPERAGTEAAAGGMGAPPRADAA